MNILGVLNAATGKVEPVGSLLFPIFSNTACDLTNV